MASSKPIDHGATWYIDAAALTASGRGCMREMAGRRACVRVRPATVPQGHASRLASMIQSAEEKKTDAHTATLDYVPT